MSRPREILGRSSIYAFGNAVRGLASFLMLPIYTRYLTPGDYGVIELITVVLDLFLLMLGTRVSAGIYKLYVDSPDDPGRRQVVTTSLLTMVGIHGVAVVAIALLRQPISGALNVTPDFGNALAVFAMSAVFGAVSEVLLALLKVQDRAGTFVSFSVGRLLLQIVLNIWFVVCLGMGYWGVVWGAVLTAAATCAALLIVNARWLVPRYSYQIARQLVAYSAPIVLASLGMYYILFANRYFLEHFEGVAAVGIFAIANKFGALMFTVVAGPFGDYWNARQFSAAREPDAPMLFGYVFYYAVFLMLVCLVGLAVAGPSVIRLIADASYWSAGALVPWIALSYLLQAVGDFFRVGSLVSGQTRYVTYSSLVAVALATTLNLLLIPRFGAFGAAIALVGAMAGRLVMLYASSQRLFPIRVMASRLVALCAVFSIVAVIGTLMRSDTVPGILLQLSVVAVLSAIAMATPLLPRSHREWIWRSITSAVSGRRPG